MALLKSDHTLVPRPEEGEQTQRGARNMWSQGGRRGSATPSVWMSPPSGPVHQCTRTGQRLQAFHREHNPAKD